jgi:glucosamine-6-phosphate deaminase
LLLLSIVPLKDIPGDDAREFWVRTENRNRETARCYNELGLAEYTVMVYYCRNG